MNRLIENALGLYFDGFFTQSKRLVQQQSLKLWLEGLQGIRKLWLLLLASAGFIVLITATLLNMINHGTFQMQNYGLLSFDFVWFVSLLVLGISALSLAYTVSERRWIEAFGVREKLQHSLDRSNRKSAMNSTEPSFDTQELRKIVESVVDQKFRQWANHIEAGETPRFALDERAKEPVPFIYPQDSVQSGSRPPIAKS